jgi:hypothetical protein
MLSIQDIFTTIVAYLLWCWFLKHRLQLGVGTYASTFIPPPCYLIILFNGFCNSKYIYQERPQTKFKVEMLHNPMVILQNYDI